MKIALIGATGFVGSALLNELLQRGHQVTVLARNPSKLPPREGLTVVAAALQPLHPDRRDLGALGRPHGHRALEDNVIQGHGVGVENDRGPDRHPRLRQPSEGHHDRHCALPVPLGERVLGAHAAGSGQGGDQQTDTKPCTHG